MTREQIIEQLGQLAKEATDKEYRTLADYVFAELAYSQSKTCCWNRSTAAMYQLVMQYNKERVYDQETQTCNPPTVFKAVDGNYQVFLHMVDVQGWAAFRRGFDDEIIKLPTRILASDFENEIPAGA